MIELEQWLDQQLDLGAMPDLLYVGKELSDPLTTVPADEALERMFDYGVVPRLIVAVTGCPHVESLLILMGYIPTKGLWLYMDDVPNGSTQDW